MKKFTLVLFLLAGHFAHAQVPNGGFETWYTPAGVTFTEPESWTTSNGPLAQLPVPAPANVTEETVSVSEGTSAVKLTTSAILGGAALASGALSSGNITYDQANTTLTFDGGFDYTGRPGQLTGMYKYTPVAGDTAIIWVVLTRWNAGVRDTVATGAALFGAAVSAYEPFGVTLNYQSTEDPDTALIVALSTKRIVVIGGAPGSTLWLDDMAFEFGASVEGVDNVKAINAYPNPANDAVSILVSLKSSQDVTVEIADVLGKVVATYDYKNVTAGTSKVQLDVANLASGMYVANVRTGAGMVSRKFIKE